MEVVLPMSPEAIKEITHKVGMGIPAMDVFATGARSLLFLQPADGHLWFAPIIPRTGEAVIESHDAFIEEVKKYNVPMPLIRRTQLPQAWHVRGYIMLFPFFTSRSDENANAGVRAVFPGIVKMAATTREVCERLVAWLTSHAVLSTVKALSIGCGWRVFLCFARHPAVSQDRLVRMAGSFRESGVL